MLNPKRDVNSTSCVHSILEDLALTVAARDASIANPPRQFKLCRVQRLEDEQVREMLERYLKARPTGALRQLWELDVESSTPSAPTILY